jgi:biotin transport system substrate-specific component
MNIVTAYKGIAHLKKHYYDWYYGSAWTKKLMMALSMSVLTGIAAQVRIPLFFTPVPITGQVFAVLLSGIILDKVYAGLSMLFYVLIGFCGIPWFSGAAAGLPIGPTTGYILGFIPAAFLIGNAIHHRKTGISLWELVAVMMTAVSIIYLFGAIHFTLFTGSTVKTTLFMSVLPFIPFDLAKALGAACIARVLVLNEK